jgi:mono/diheme cytochrome c family protein
LTRKAFASISIFAYLSLLHSCQTKDEINYARYYTGGKVLYDTHCTNCHNADGKGLGNLIPPLTDSFFLQKNKKLLACIIKEGLKDSITIGGKTFNEPMPANHQLTAMDIAQIVTYITNSFGNKQGLYNVNNADSDLKNCGH